MPKKFKGENSKATEARARKAAVVNEEAERRKKDAEDALWVDDDRQLAKKSQRKEDKEKKRLEQLERKKDLARLHDEEMEATKVGPKAKSSAAAIKVTRYELDKRREVGEAEAATERTLDKSITVVDTDEPLEENLNRLAVEGEAHTVDDAITVLSQTGKDSVDRHPEKRVKAAYQEFEDSRLPELKKENPNLRLSQLKQMLKKEWQKSPANPLNARLLK